MAKKENILPKKYIYRIIITNRSKQVDEIYMSYDEVDVFEEFNRLKEKSMNVRFPVRYNNNKTEIIPCEYEIMIIKVKTDNEDSVSTVMDDMGRFVECNTTNENWIVLDRYSYQKEETFFVYGHHPRYDRKTFNWIFDNMIREKGKDKYSFLTIRTYLNKVIIGDNNDMGIIICKNRADSSRFYTELYNDCEKNKLKHVAFMGDIAKSKYKSEWIDKLCKFTGWNRTKIKRSSTRP